MASTPERGMLFKVLRAPVGPFAIGAAGAGDRPSVWRLILQLQPAWGQGPQTFLIFAGHSCSSNAPEITASRHSRTYSYTHTLM